MKEIIRKSKIKIKKLPHRVVIDEKGKDFSKLFDMMNYKIVIKKQEKYGIKRQHIDWFKSYLNSWKQCVCYSKGTLPLKEVTCGAPQGSILDPLLSLIFADDFPHVTNFLNSIIFAVETNIFYPNSITKELFENVNKELTDVTHCCVTNKMSINASKISS